MQTAKEQTAEEYRYKKFYYWIPTDKIYQVLENLKANIGKNEIYSAKLRQCEALQPSRTIMHVPPSIWSENCFRQGSWFRTSKWKEYHLIVSNSELKLDNCALRGHISIIQIKDLTSPNEDEYMKLLNTPEFKKRAPEEWFHLLDREKPLFQSYLDRNHISITLDHFLEMHSANHANFLLPSNHVNVRNDEKGAKIKIIEYNGEKIPCSLFPQEFICSACLELFNVLGAHHPKKILKNCPGLKYIKLMDDQYFLVEIEPEC